MYKNGFSHCQKQSEVMEQYRQSTINEVFHVDFETFLWKTREIEDDV